MATLPEVATKLVSAFAGPLTLIFNVPSDTFSKTVTGGLETVAFRMPDNQATLALIEQANVPLAHQVRTLLASLVQHLQSMFIMICRGKLLPY